MQFPNFGPSEVLRSHAEAQHTRLVESVVPEPTTIDIDPAALQAFAGQLGTTEFSKTSLLLVRPNNALIGVRFAFSEDGHEVSFEHGARVNKETALEFANLIAPIDHHFRAWFGVPDHITTKPKVNLIAGTYHGSDSEISRHLDFAGALPQVNYKIYFEGAPDHASIYYPGTYKIPRRLQQFVRAVGGAQPTTLIPQFKRREAVRHVMPADIVCVEPWNAYHSGPTARTAQGTRRGILSVSYISQKSRNTA